MASSLDRESKRRPIAFSAALFCAAVLSLVLAAVSAEAAAAELPALVARIEAGEHSPEFAREVVLFAERNSAALPELSAAVARSPQLNPVVREESLRQAEAILVAGAPSEVLPLKRAATQLLPESEQMVGLYQLIATAEMVEHYVATGDIGKLKQLRESVRTPGEARIVNAHLSRLMLALAQQAIEGGEPQRSLSLLAQIDASFWGDRAGDLAREAIIKLERGIEEDPKRVAAFDQLARDPDVTTLLLKIGGKDPGIRDTLADLYSARVLQALRADDVEQAGAYYGETLKLRPDPSEANNTLRRRIVSVAHGPEAKSFAWGRVSELQAAGGLRFIDRLRLLFRGYYGQFFPSMLLFLIIFFFALGAVSLCNPSLFAIRLPTLRWKFNASAQKVRPAARRSEPGYLRGYVDGDDEYSRLLSLFGLEDSASEDEIKRVYRQEVKRYHPDMQQDESNPDSQRFRELKVAYERIMEIRGSWFSGR